MRRVRALLLASPLVHAPAALAVAGSGSSRYSSGGSAGGVSTGFDGAGS